MRGGRLRHRVTIQRREDQLNNLGQNVQTWKDWCTVYAEVRDLSGREAERARQIVAEATIAVSIRHLPGLTTSDRVQFRDRILWIGAITDVSDNTQREQVLTCGETKQ
jgi:SPP1 family predicted phage head-tail adaptor